MATQLFLYNAGTTLLGCGLDGIGGLLATTPSSFVKVNKLTGTSSGVATISGTNRGITSIATTSTTSYVFIGSNDIYEYLDNNGTFSKTINVATGEYIMALTGKLVNSEYRCYYYPAENTGVLKYLVYGTSTIHTVSSSGTSLALSGLTEMGGYFYGCGYNDHTIYKIDYTTGIATVVLVADSSITWRYITNDGTNLYACAQDVGAYRIGLNSDGSVANMSLISVGASAHKWHGIAYLNAKLYMTALDGYIIGISTPYLGDDITGPSCSSTGPFYNATNITLTADSGCTIYYTTDGTTPTKSSNLYSAPILLDGVPTIKARAYNGNSFSSVNTFNLTWTISAPVVTWNKSSNYVTRLRLPNPNVDKPIKIGPVNSKNYYPKGPYINNDKTKIAYIEWTDYSTPSKLWTSTDDGGNWISTLLPYAIHTITWDSNNNMVGWGQGKYVLDTSNVWHTLDSSTYATEGIVFDVTSTYDSQINTTTIPNPTGVSGTYTKFAYNNKLYLVSEDGIRVYDFATTTWTKLLSYTFITSTGYTGFTRIPAIFVHDGIAYFEASGHFAHSNGTIYGGAIRYNIALNIITFYPIRGNSDMIWTVLGNNYLLTQMYYNNLQTIVKFNTITNYYTGVQTISATCATSGVTYKISYGGDYYDFTGNYTLPVYGELSVIVEASKSGYTSSYSDVCTIYSIEANYEYYASLSGVWKKISNMYVSQAGVWKTVSKLYKAESGAYVEKI